MSNSQVVETIHGKYSKYEIKKKITTLDGIKFYIYKDGKPHQGAYSSLSDAVAAARKEAG